MIVLGIIAGALFGAMAAGLAIARTIGTTQEIEALRWAHTDEMENAE